MSLWEPRLATRSAASLCSSSNRSFRRCGSNALNPASPPPLSDACGSVRSRDRKGVPRGPRSVTGSGRGGHFRRPNRSGPPGRCGPPKALKTWRAGGCSPVLRRVFNRAVAKMRAKRVCQDTRHTKPPARPLQGLDSSRGTDGFARVPGLFPAFSFWRRFSCRRRCSRS